MNAEQVQRSRPSPAPRSPLALPTRSSLPSAVRAAEPIRWSRVMTAQARVAVGFYDREDVQDCVAEAVLRELQRH